MDLIQLLNMSDIPYRVFYLVTELGWIDVDLRSSPGWQAAFLGKYCTAHRLSSTVKSKSTSPPAQTGSTVRARNETKHGQIRVSERAS